MNPSIMGTDGSVVDLGDITTPSVAMVSTNVQDLESRLSELQHLAAAFEIMFQKVKEVEGQLADAKLYGEALAAVCREVLFVEGDAWDEVRTPLNEWEKFIKSEETK